MAILELRLIDESDDVVAKVEFDPPIKTPQEVEVTWENVPPGTHIVRPVLVTKSGPQQPGPEFEFEA